MNTKRTLATLISASLLTLTVAPVALAGDANTVADQATTEINHADDRTMAQVNRATDPVTADRNDATESDSNVKKAADKTTGAVSNTWVQGKLKAALLADDHLSGFAINTEVKNGVATLTGPVDTKADIDRATKLAMSIEGITDVKNSLVVEPSEKARATTKMDRTTDKTTRDMDRATDRTAVDMDHEMDSDSNVKKAADKTTGAVSDNWSQGKLEASFMADDNLSSFAINTQVIDGVATLTGNVDSKADSDHATKVAKSIKGITAVKNLLMVKPSE